MLTKLRRALAWLLDKNSNVCWADLAVWAEGYYLFSDVNCSGSCKRPPMFDEKWGGCYCGKHRTPEGGAQ